MLLNKAALVILPWITPSGPYPAAQTIIRIFSISIWAIDACLCFYLNDDDEDLSHFQNFMHAEVSVECFMLIRSLKLSNNNEVGHVILIV